MMMRGTVAAVFLVILVGHASAEFAPCSSAYGDDPNRCLPSLMVTVTKGFPPPATPGQWYIVRLANQHAICEEITEKAKCMSTANVQCGFDDVTYTPGRCVYNETNGVDIQKALLADGGLVVNCTAGNSTGIYLDSAIDAETKCGNYNTSATCPVDYCYWQSDMCISTYYGIHMTYINGSAGPAAKLFEDAFNAKCPPAAKTGQCGGTPQTRDVSAIKFFLDTPVNCTLPKIGTKASFGSPVARFSSVVLAICSVLVGVFWIL